MTDIKHGVKPTRGQKKLLAAQKDPGQYRDLVVRIGGYSDYFVKLSPNMQAEVLERTEHVL